MKKFEVSAYSLEEAKATALSEYGLKVTQNVSQSWKNAGSPVSGKEFEGFCIDMLDKKRLTGVEGVGLVIVVLSSLWLSVFFRMIKGFYTETF